MAFIFLPYFQHTSIFQNTNVLPLSTAEPQHPARCIINDQEREPGFALVLHPQPLASLLPKATKEAAATSCGALWKFEGSGITSTRKRCERPDQALPPPAPFPYSL